MKHSYIVICCFLVVIAQNAFAQSPIEFIENQGQWDSWIKYKATTPGGEVHLENDGLRYILSEETNWLKVDSFHHGQLTVAPTLKFHVYKMTFEGANLQHGIQGLKKQNNYYNYFLGNDPAKWKSGIHPYYALDYNSLYTGIDMHLTSENQSLVYELYVQPNADASQIKIKYDGPDRMSIKNGDLIVNTSVGKIIERKPVVYQYINDSRVSVACDYNLKGNTLTFDFPNGYDHSKLLIIDPTIDFWASFTGSTADNWGFTATYDDTGNFYMGGIVNCLDPVTGSLGTGSFPVSPGAYQTVWGGGQGVSGVQFGSDIGIMKLSPDGHNRIYATYLGGIHNERPSSMIVDGSGNLVITGRTLSPNFPVTSGAVQSTIHGGSDIFVTKLNPAGSALVGSTFMGGSGHDGVNFDSTEYGYGHLKYNYGDDARGEVQVDGAGNVYVAGSTQSADFPTTPSAIGTTLTGFQAGVVFKLNSTLTSMLWSTYINGNGDDAAYVLAFNPSQSSIYVAGGSSSTNLPVPSGAWRSSYGGDSADGYVLKFKNSAPYNVQKGSYVGTSHFDQVYGIQVDGNGNVYMMGQSLGGTFPTTAGVYANPGSTQFVIKMDSNLTTDLISTVYGSGDATHTNISPVAFLVDTCENVYVSGWGGNIMGATVTGLAHSGVTTGMPTTPDAQQSTTDGFDFYFIVFGPGMTALRYATFYGRNAPGGYGEHVDGGTSRFDKHGIIYQGICANCGGPPSVSGQPAFPTTSGVWGPTDNSPNCNMAGLKIAFNIGPVETHVTAGPSTSGCAPLTVVFTNTSTNALTYLWDFGDGSPTVTTFAPTHTFTAAGTFTVTLSAANANACFKTQDTTRLIISVDTNRIIPGFNYTVTDSCGPYTAEFTNTSSTNISSSTPEYTWYFGDGTNFTGATPPTHSYPDTGTYTVMLVMAQTGACKTPDTVQKKIRIFAAKVSANFDIPDSICLGSPFVPAGGATNATSITWNLGNGTTVTITNPVITYSVAGTYSITLTALNPGSCNLQDSVTQVIRVLSGPRADFSFVPLVPQTNVPTTFTNKSYNATRYAWDFGDNQSSTEINPVHQYNVTGTYDACLTAYNTSNCPAKVCKPVPSDVVPLIGIPTAFSPNGDGENDILYVRGGAIKTLDLKIYNRWGQLVFETTSQEIGWDGKFNGQPQPIEAYGYVLQASFIDGTSKTLKGNITLLR